MKTVFIIDGELILERPLSELYQEYAHNVSNIPIMYSTMEDAEEALEGIAA